MSLLLLFQPLAISGAADVTIAGSALAAVGAETFTGTGTVTLAVAGLSGTGAETVTGAATTTIAVASLAGAAVETFAGSGAVAISGARLEASGETAGDVTGAATITIQAAVLEATGEAEVVNPPVDVVGGGGGGGRITRAVARRHRPVTVFPQAITGVGRLTIAGSVTRGRGTVTRRSDDEDALIFGFIDLEEMAA